MQDAGISSQRLIASSASVLALVPHYRCETWLVQCLASLVSQTRPLAGIAVIDDASEYLPIEIVRRFPQVTLLAASENVGPYALIQQVIHDTAYDAYLLQDADDWSTQDRLAVLLAEAERTGAELVGSQAHLVDEEGRVGACWESPLDVNVALIKAPGKYPLLHATGLIARELVLRAGGFATGMRFSGDGEFVRRAHHVARVRNVPRSCYFYRMRTGSLISANATHLLSPARLRVRARLLEQARANAARGARGEAPDMTPYAVREPVRIVHVLGPALKRQPSMTRAGAGDGLLPGGVKRLSHGGLVATAVKSPVDSAPRLSDPKGNDATQESRRTS